MTPDRFVKISGRKIKAYRDEHGLSQTEVAANLEMTARRLRGIENGDAVNVRRTNLGRFAGALKMSLADFIEQFAAAPTPDDIPAINALNDRSLDALLDRIIAEREARRLPPLPEHVEAAVLKRAAKPMPKKS